MNEKIKNGFFSLSGLSITIGCVGFISGIVTMFVNVGDQLAIKWFILLALTSSTIIMILLKTVHDLTSEIKPSAPYEHPIKLLPEGQILVIRRNENFINNIILGCYAQTDEIDRLAYLAVVHLIQDKIIQIRIISDLKILDKIPSTKEELKNLIIRPVVPFDAINDLILEKNDV
ncbi:hypothetical protein ACQKP5_15195 [Pseudomonas vancouverensis]|uniref:hypothetical protein n=1 Tax=Pseudomonas vancouverensis TaxID=95300 RepID=UPI003CFDA6AA